MAGREGDYVKNLANKTDLTNDTKKETKSKRNVQSENQKNAIIGIVGTGIFAVLTILLPFLKVLGGFLTYSDFNELFGPRKMVFYWDQISTESWGRILFTYSISYI